MTASSTPATTLHSSTSHTNMTKAKHQPPPKRAGAWAQMTTVIIDHPGADSDNEDKQETVVYDNATAAWASALRGGHEEPARLVRFDAAHNAAPPAGARHRSPRLPHPSLFPSLIWFGLAVHMYLRSSEGREAKTFSPSTIPYAQTHRKSSKPRASVPPEKRGSASLPKSLATTTMQAQPLLALSQAVPQCQSVVYAS